MRQKRLSMHRRADLSTFAGRVLHLRRKRKLTQGQVAEAAGVTRCTVTNWEAGVSIAREAAARRLAEFLQCDVSYLLRGKDAVALVESKPKQQGTQPLIDLSAFDEAVKVLRRSPWSPAQATALKALIDVGVAA